MTLVAVLCGLAGGVGAGALGMAFDLYRGAKWFVYMGIVSVSSVVALTILIIEYDANGLALFAFLLPGLASSFRRAYFALRASVKRRSGAEG